MEEESWRRIHEGGIMEDESWRRDHRGGILGMETRIVTKEDACRGNSVEGVRREDSGGILEE